MRTRLQALNLDRACLVTHKHGNAYCSELPACACHCALHSTAQVCACACLPATLWQCLSCQCIVQAGNGGRHRDEQTGTLTLGNICRHATHNHSFLSPTPYQEVQARESHNPIPSKLRTLNTAAALLTTAAVDCGRQHCCGHEGERCSSPAIACL